jgi:tetraacyldisaccharide 4'-kinase
MHDFGERGIHARDVTLADWHRAIVSTNSGALNAPIRTGLSLLESIYALTVRRRNLRYDRGEGVIRVSAPVIGVGNITVGGTGKTPMVIELVSRLERLGRRVGVLARGYKSKSDSPNDEELLIRRRCPNAAYRADPNRVRGAQRLIDERHVDVILLDDGFQHRRLARSLDMVLIDATCPFGHGRLLPRGLLREPLTSLRRADVFVVTRFDQVCEDDLNRITEQLHALSPSIPILHCCHQVNDITSLDGVPMKPPPRQQRAMLFAGIARPGAFEHTVTSAGVIAVARRWFPDHHNYRYADVEKLLREARVAGADLLVTTEKDAVKLAEIPRLNSITIAVVAVNIQFTSGNSDQMNNLLQNAIAPRRS